jgi:hypothetical protein
MPKTVEVDEVDFQRNQALRQTVEKIMAHPEARLLVEQAHKLVVPDAKTPTLDAQKKQSEPIDALRKEVSDFIKAQNEANTKRETDAQLAALTARRDAGFAELRTKHGYNPDGIKKIEEIMEKKGILDPLDAAVIFERDNPPPAPVQSSSSSWNFPEIPKDGGDAYEKALLDSRGNNDLIAERRAMEVLQEIRGNRN